MKFKLIKINVPRGTLIHKMCWKVVFFGILLTKCLQKSTKIVELVCAIEMFEPGQDWKVAALRSSFYVHFFCSWLFMNLKYMDLAFKEARKAFKQDEVPIGAILVKNDEMIAKSHNKKEKKMCCLEHAELNVIKKASKK